MAYTYTTDLKRGTKSDDVKTLQTALNESGYNLAVDGSFGSKTQAALNDYQSKNGLSGGVFDQATADKLYGGLNEIEASRPEDYNPVTYTGNEKTFMPTAYNASQNTDYQTAQQAVKDYTANKPEAYTNQYDAQIDALYQQIMNRGNFAYDLNSDALYQQYKDQYTTLGKQAMQDTMGQAAALTGGYGNTYAQSVGQQQYDAYLQRLNDVIPELYSQAYSQWADEGNQLKDLYSLTVNQEQNAYDRYQDNVNMYYNDLDRLQATADDAYDRGYQQWKDQTSAASDLADYYVTLMSNGIDVPDNLLAEAGISDAYKKLIMSQLNSGSTSGTGAGGGDDANANQTALYQSLKNTFGSESYVNGTDSRKTDSTGNQLYRDSEVADMLDTLVDQGKITESQMVDLAQTYEANKKKFRGEDL